jgi:phage terminase large subunit-like protein
LGRIADELGTPLMAWQQFVADVGLEVDPETGRLAYKEVIVSVMRQNGKTTLVLAAECERCLMWGHEQRVAYTAQTGKDARAKFKDDHLPIIDRSPLKSLVRRPYLSDGNTALLWDNGSRISVLDNTPAAGHGKTLDLAIIDEAFADQDNMREQALLPTMATRKDAQIWNVSTAGTQASTYLKRKVDIGRAAVRTDQREGIAYFEWSILEDEDVEDPAVHAKRMPAYGVTIFPDYIAHARRTMTDGDFRRAIGNQWTETEERVIPAEWWRAVCSTDVRCESPLFVIEAKPDHSQACVVKADASGSVELVAVRPGVDWLRAAIPEKVGKSVQLVVDGHGPVAHIADDLEGEGHTVVRLDSLAVRKACGRFFDAVADQKVQVRSDERLDAAVAAAVKKASSDTWSWHRETPGGELLMGMSLAFAAAVTESDVFTPFAWS